MQRYDADELQPVLAKLQETHGVTPLFLELWNEDQKQGSNFPL